jgi:hypothetical protein
MLKRALWICLCWISTVSSQTMLAGKIDDITFTPQGNPFIVQKDIEVSKGKTVVIPPGCVLLFNPFTGLQNFGRLIIKGSPDNLVIFTSINDADHNPSATLLPNPFDWNGIFIAQESDGAFLNNFSLKYSVYGIKSQNANVTLQNGTFQQNGQFHFTINDQIQVVQDNIPFSYGTKETEPPRPEKLTTASAGQAPADNTTKKAIPHKKVIRIASLGVGAAGAVLGTVFAIRASQAKQELETIGNTGIADLISQDLKDWDKTNTRYKSSTAACIISYSIGALGLIGFGVTFAF